MLQVWVSACFFSQRGKIEALEELRRKAVDRAVLLAAERRKKACVSFLGKIRKAGRGAAMVLRVQVKEQDADQGHSEGEQLGRKVLVYNWSSHWPQKCFSV